MEIKRFGYVSGCCICVSLLLIVLGASFPAIYWAMALKLIKDGNISKQDWSNEELVDRYTMEVEYNMSLYTITNLEHVMTSSYPTKLNIEEISVPMKRKTIPFDFEWQNRNGHTTVKYKVWDQDEYVNPADADRIIVMPNALYPMAIEGQGQSETLLSTALAYKFYEGVAAYFAAPDSTLNIAIRAYAYSAWFAETNEIAKAEGQSQSITDGSAKQTAALWINHAQTLNTGTMSTADAANFAGWKSLNPSLINGAAPTTSDAEILFGASGCTDTSDPPTLTTCVNSPLVNPAVALLLAGAAAELAAGNTDGTNVLACTAMGYSTAGIIAIGSHIVVISGLSATDFGYGADYTPAPTLIPLLQQNIANQATASFSETATWDLTNLDTFQKFFEYQIATGEFIRYTAPGLGSQTWGHTFTTIGLTARPVSMNDQNGFDDSTTIPNTVDLSGGAVANYNTWSFKMTEAEWAAFKTWIMGGENQNLLFTGMYQQAGTRALQMMECLTLAAAGNTTALAAWQAETDSLVLQIQTDRSIAGSDTNNAAYYNYWATNTVVERLANASAAAAATAAGASAIPSDPVYAAAHAQALGGFMALQYAMDGARGFMKTAVIPMLSSLSFTNYDATGCIIYTPTIDGTDATWNPILDWIKLQRCVNYLQQIGFWQALYGGAMLGTTSDPGDAVLAGYGTFAGNIGPFVRQTVNETLYGWDDPLLVAFGMGAMNPTVGFNGPNLTSAAHARNANAVDGMEEVYTGEPDSSKAGEWYAYEQIENLCRFDDMWTDPSTPGDCVTLLGSTHEDCRVWKECISLEGYRLAQWPWKTSADIEERMANPPAELEVFVTQAMRPVTLKYDKTETYKGIQLWNYVLKEDALTYNAENDKYRMEPSAYPGFFDLQWVEEGAPVGLSQPYFGPSAPDSLLSQITYTATSHPEGFPYIADFHQTRIQIDPLTGRLMVADRQLQASVMLKKSVLDSPIWNKLFDGAGINASSPFPNDRIYLPAYWVHEHAAIKDEDAADYVMKLITFPQTLGKIQIALPIVGVFLLIATWYHMRPKASAEEKEMGSPKVAPTTLPSSPIGPDF